MSTMDAPKEVRFVRVERHRGRRLFDRFPRAMHFFGDKQNYTEDWVLDHVRTGAMEMWDIRQEDDSVGLVAGFRQTNGVSPTYWIWAFYLSPETRGDYDPLEITEWLKDRARLLGCTLLEFITPRHPDAAARRAAQIGFTRAYTGFQLEVTP